MYLLPLVYKRGATARRKLRLGERQGPAEDRFIHNQEQILLPVDVGYYAPAARTTLDPVFLCVCLSVRLAPSPSTSRVLPHWEQAGALRHPAVGTLEIPRQGSS